jgi:hypothetical protein
VSIYGSHTPPAFAGLAYAHFVELDIPGDCTNLIAWRQCVAARPGIAG